MTLTKIKTGGIQDDAVTSAKIPADAVGSSELAANSVTTAKIATGAVVTGHLAGGSVTSAKIQDGTITQYDLADQAVTLAKLPHGTSSNDGKFLRANNGADPTFEAIPPAAITAVGNTGANRVITDDGDGTATAEANLTFDGTALGVTGYADVRTGSSINTNVTGGSASGTLHKNTTSGEFATVSGGSGGNNYLTFYTSASAAPTEKLRITHDGKLGIGTGNPQRPIHQHISSSGSNYHQFTNSTTGSAGGDGLVIGLDSNEDAIIWNQENEDIRFGVNNSERLRLTSAGVLQLRNVAGNIRMSFENSGGLNFITSNSGEEIKVSSGNGDSNGIEFWDYTGTNKRCQIDGHGIKFNNDTAEANGLDDYEEGNWTPSGSGFTVSSVISARYTKVGRLVTVNAYLNAATGSGSSAVVITGLPYTQYANSNYHYGSGRIGSAGGNTNSQNNIVFQVVQNSSTVKIYVNDGGINEQMISGQHIIFSATYEAA